MKGLLWSSMALGVGLLVLLAAHSMCGRLEDQTLLVSHPSGVENEIEEANRRRAALDAQDQAVLERIAARYRIVDALLEGRLTLRQAAARFRQLNPSSAEAPWLPVTYPARSEEERCCRQVMVYARHVLRNRPEEAQRILPRLEAELQAYLESNGAARHQDPVSDASQMR